VRKSVANVADPDSPKITLSPEAIEVIPLRANEVAKLKEPSSILKPVISAVAEPR
jgi:hypothetical protein